MAQPETFFDNLLEKFRKRGSSQQYTNTLFRVIGTIRVSSYEVSCRPIDLELPLIIWESLAIGYRRFSRLAPAILGNGDHNLPLAPPLSAEDARHLLGYFFHQVVINGVGSLSFTPLLNELLRIQPRQAPCLVAHVMRSTPPPRLSKHRIYSHPTATPTKATCETHPQSVLCVSSCLPHPVPRRTPWRIPVIPCTESHWRPSSQPWSHGTDGQHWAHECPFAVSAIIRRSGRV